MNKYAQPFPEKTFKHNLLIRNGMVNYVPFIL